MGEIYDFVGHADYYILGAAAFWGLMCIIMVWNRVLSKRFKNEQQQDAFLIQIEQKLEVGDFEGAKQLCQGDKRVSERLKGASDGRFKRVQFDRKGMGHSDRWILRSPSIGVCPWYVGWICTKRRELSICFRQGCPSERSLGRSESTVNR